MIEIMVWRNNAWVKQTVEQMPEHSTGRPEECDRCMAELYADLQRFASKRTRTEVRNND